MLGDLFGPVWIFDNPNALTDIIFDYNRIITHTKEETI